MNSNSDSLQALYKQGDKIMVGVIWFLFVMSLGLSAWYGTMAEAIWIGLPSALLPTLLYFKLGGSLVSRLVNATSFMVFCALHIHQAHGMIEIHFGIFVLLAFLLFYRDWKPIVTAAAVIAAHHLSFNFMQAGGVGVYLFESNYEPELLLESHRPFFLKQRIFGNKGHLSNIEATIILKEIMTERTKHIIFVHLSQECNTHYNAKEKNKEIMPRFNELDIHYSRQDIQPKDIEIKE